MFFVFASQLQYAAQLVCDCEACTKSQRPKIQEIAAENDAGAFFWRLKLSGWDIENISTRLEEMDFAGFVTTWDRLISDRLRQSGQYTPTLFKCYAPGHYPDKQTEAPQQTATGVDWRRAALMNYEHLTKLLLMMHMGELAFSDKVEPYVQAHVRRMVADSLAKTSELILSDAEACSILGIQDRLMIISPNFMNDTFDKNNK